MRDTVFLQIAVKHFFVGNISECNGFSPALLLYFGKIDRGRIVSNGFIYLRIKIDIIGYLIIFCLIINAVLFQIIARKNMVHVS